MKLRDFVKEAEDKEKRDFILAIAFTILAAITIGLLCRTVI